MKEFSDYRKMALNCLLPLLVSLFIYVFFRTGETVVNKLFFSFPNEPIVSVQHTEWDWFVFNLPGALWLYAFIFFNSFYDKSFRNSLLPLALALGIEMCQLLHLTDGTFDVLDVVFYLLAWTFAYGFGTVLPGLREMERTTQLPLKRRFVYGFFTSIVFLSDVWPS